MNTIYQGPKPNLPKQQNLSNQSKPNKPKKLPIKTYCKKLTKSTFHSKLTKQKPANPEKNKKKTGKPN